MWDTPVVYKQVGEDAIIELAHSTAGLDLPPTTDGNKALNERNNNMLEGGNANWYGCPGKVALKRLKEGWPEGVKEMQDNLRQVEVPHIPRRKRTRFGWDGEVDVERVLFNEPEPFRSHSRIMAPVVRLTVDVGANGGTSGGTLKWRGTVALAIADALSQAGFSVEIVVMERAMDMWHGAGKGKGPQGSTYTILKLKDAQAPLNLPLLAGGIMTAAIFRITMWRSWYRGPWSLNSSHGRWYPMGEQMMGDIHIDHTVSNLETAKKFLAELPTCKKADLKAFILKGGR